MNFFEELDAAKERAKDPRFPSLGRMGATYSGAVIRSALKWMGGKPIRTTKEEAQRRLAICKKCTDLITTDKDTIACARCGCNMAEKANWIVAVCPKWSSPEMVSVIITARNEGAFVQKTIDSVFETATGHVEILLALDGLPYPKLAKDNRVHITKFKKPQGLRITRNKIIKEANGKYLFFLDAHCALTPGWDLALKAFCTEHTALVCVLDGLDPNTWEPRGNEHGFVDINEQFAEKWSPRKPDDRYLVEETQGITGCGWMIQKHFFDELTGFDEQLAPYGGDGPEMALKVWMHPNGRFLLHKGVKCSHVFRGQPSNEIKTVPFKIDPIGIANVYKALQKKYIDDWNSTWPRGIEWLRDKFKDTSKKAKQKGSPVQSNDGKTRHRTEITDVAGHAERLKSIVSVTLILPVSRGERVNEETIESFLYQDYCFGAKKLKIYNGGKYPIQFDEYHPEIEIIDMPILHDNKMWHDILSNIDTELWGFIENGNIFLPRYISNLVKAYTATKAKHSEEDNYYIIRNIKNLRLKPSGEVAIHEDQVFSAFPLASVQNGVPAELLLDLLKEDKVEEFSTKLMLWEGWKNIGLANTAPTYCLRENVCTTDGDNSNIDPHWTIDYCNELKRRLSESTEKDKA